MERELEIIGEAARRISESFRQAHPEIPWREIIGQRNILAHDYGDVDAELIWKAVTQDLPQLIGYLDSLVPRTQE
jgi:uncharacterized protein with HEPN domain